MQMIGHSLPMVQQRFKLLPAERLLLVLVLCLGLAAILLALALNRDVEWLPFIVGYVASVCFIPLGAFIRKSKASPRLGLGLVGVGCFCGATAAFSILTFSLLPIPNAMVDDWLVKTGHWVGYDWRDFVIYMSGYPALTTMLSYVYQVAPLLLLVTVCVLSAQDQAVALHRFLFVGIVTLLLTVTIWWIWPSVGYYGKLPLSAEVLAQNRLIYGTDYGVFLTNLIQHGPKRITPEVITGVVGFPSYHMVMACLAGWYCSRTVLMVPMALVTVAMVPATLVHGGHHLVDLLGGLVIFGFSVWLANRAIRAPTSA